MAIGGTLSDGMWFDVAIENEDGSFVGVRISRDGSEVAFEMAKDDGGSLSFVSFSNPDHIRQFAEELSRIADRLESDD